MSYINRIRQRIYIVDYFNVYSDYREIKYKRMNIDFHRVKHANKELDTRNFFDIFFTRYIDHAGINKQSRFIFVMKKLNDYQHVLENIVYKHRNFNLQLAVIEDKYKKDIVDKNKDDFVCQYLFSYFQKNNDCILISNDKYRDNQHYINMFNFDIRLSIFKYDHNTLSIIKDNAYLEISKKVDINQHFTRTVIPKNKIHLIL